MSILKLYFKLQTSTLDFIPKLQLSCFKLKMSSIKLQMANSPTNSKILKKPDGLTHESLGKNLQGINQPTHINRLSDKKKIWYVRLTSVHLQLFATRLVYTEFSLKESHQSLKAEPQHKLFDY